MDLWGGPGSSGVVLGRCSLQETLFSSFSGPGDPVSGAMFDLSWEEVGTNLALFGVIFGFFLVAGLKLDVGST